MEKKYLTELLQTNCTRPVSTTKDNTFDYVSVSKFSTDQVNNRNNAAWKVAKYIVVEDYTKEKNEIVKNGWLKLTKGYDDQYLFLPIDDDNYQIYDSKFNIVSDDIILQMIDDDSDKRKKLSENLVRGGENWLYYGAPGCGKSHEIKEALSNIEKENIFRVTFHPEYTNSDFVGQILPKVTKDKVTYEFYPGPFTLALEKAFTTQSHIYLIIEEINRGNAAAIFGDIFQLLDREKPYKDGVLNENYGQSEYEIDNPLVVDYLKSKIILPKDFKLYIPKNLCIYATMNTSDQNVFTLDTAFKRRWQLHQVSNEFEDNHPYKDYYIPGTKVTWQNFLGVINPQILSLRNRNQSSEDKQIGKYFVDPTCLLYEFTPIEECQGQAEQFAYKVLEYLWNDVCRINKDDMFKSQYSTLENLIKAFLKPEYNDNPLSIFKDDLF